MSVQETTDNAERLFHVAKLELLCEYRTESGVEVDAAGFVSFCYERQQFLYQDGTAARCIVRLVSQVNASSDRTRRNAVPSDFVAARATLRTDEEVNVVEAATRHTACRKVFVLYMEPLLQSHATLVRVFVRAWQNTNRLGKSAAAWLLGALEYVAADYCADLRANEPSRAARAIDEFYVPRLVFARGQQPPSSVNVTDTCLTTTTTATTTTTTSSNTEQKRAYVATQQVTEYYWFSVRRDVLAAQFSKYVKSASQRNRTTTARLLPQRIKDSKTLVDVMQENSRDLLVLSNALYDVARLVDAQIPTALAAPRCVDCVRFSRADLPPAGQKDDRQKQRMFRQSYQSCIDVHLDSQQRGCVQFLQEMERAERADEHRTLRYLALSRTDYVYNVRQRRIERSSWQRLCVEFEQRSTRTSADERMTFERRRTSPLCVDCIRGDSNVLYERPSESLVDSQLWSASCAPPPSLGWRVALLGSDSSLRCGVRTAILAHIVRSAVQCALDSDNHRRANLWLAALQSQRTIDDVCSICVLRKTLDDDQLAGATLRDVFEFCAGRVPQRDSVLGERRDERPSVARAHRASWSDLRSVATLILCSDNDVLHWLNAVAQLNEPYDSALFVAQHERCRQWYHVVRRARRRSGSSSSDSVASQFRVLARVAVVRCLSDYWRLQFVDLLTCDALIVTYEALREIEDDNCSYLSAFHSDESGEPFSRETWMRCVQHYMAGIQERRLLDLIGDDCQQTFQNNVPLEAIYWQRVVVDQPPQPIRSGGTRNRPARRALIDRFADVLRYASLIGIDRNVAPDMSSVHRTWLDWLPHIDARTDVHRSFVAHSARTMLLQESGNGTRQSTAEHTIYVTPDPEHSAVLSTAYRLMAQLQDLQALRLADIATSDGVLDLRYENQPPSTHCQSFEQLKPTYRYALQWLESNQHVASMLLRNLSDQMLQRTARFLSQINVDFEEESEEATRRRRQAYHNEAEMDAAEHGEGRRLQYDNARLLLASRAFHAMLRAASLRVEQERANVNDADHPATTGETGESGSGSTDDQEYVQMHESETESIESIQLSETDIEMDGEQQIGAQNDAQNDDEDDQGEEEDDDDDDDDEDGEEDDDEVEDDGVYMRHARRRNLTLVLNDVIRHATRSDGQREQPRLSAASVGEGSSGLFATDANRALWRRFLDIESDDTRHERIVPRDTNAMREYLSDQPSSYSFESERPEEMRTLDRFDAATGVGYSRVRGERYALQRSETLRAGMPLPYRTCVTTVRDRHLITFLNRLASERHWLPDSAADRLASARNRSQESTGAAHTSRSLGAHDTLHVAPMLADDDDDTDAQSGVDSDVAPHASTEICLYASPLNDYEQFYRRLEPALLRDVSASFRVSRDGARAHRRRDRDARNYDAPLDMNASFDVETDDSNAPESFVADVYQRELGGDAPMQEALVGARNKPRAISAAKATRAALHYTRQLRAHYNNTLRALYEERRQTLHLLIEQVRLLLANLLALSDDLIDRQQLAALQQECPPLADLSTLLSPSVVSHAEKETSTAAASVRDFETVGHTARRRREDAPLDECVDSSAHQTLCKVAEQCYAFFNDFVVDRYLKRARQQCVPSISASFLHWARQITRFRQNARWLTTDIAFVEEQRARLRNNQRTLRQTLARLSGAAQNSSHRYDDDEEHECPVCLDDIDASGVSVALYPCGHYCCWPCHVQECVEQHGVTTDSDHPETIGVADVGVRCFQCRYVLQREQRVYCVERRRRRPASPGTPQTQPQPQASTTSPQASEASIRSEPETASCDERTPKRARLDESLTAATATNDNVFVAMQFVFAKSESLLDVLKRNLCARFDACDDAPFRCVVYSQYAPMLHEVFRAVQRWLRCIGKEHDIDLFYCVRAQDLLEQQSRAYVRDMSLGQNDGVREFVAAATSAANTSSGSVGQQTAVRKRSRVSMERRADAEHSDNANGRRGVQRRHAIVFQHVDLTHDLSDLSGSIGRRDAQDADCTGSADRYCHVFSDQTVALAHESRRAPPLSDVSHAILCETLVPRLTHDARALEMAVLLEQRLIGPLHRRHRLLPPLRVIRLITTGGMDNQLHNLLVDQRNKTA